MYKIARGWNTLSADPTNHLLPFFPVINCIIVSVINSFLLFYINSIALTVKAMKSEGEIDLSNIT